jgi:hypothetical protein
MKKKGILLKKLKWLSFGIVIHMFQLVRSYDVRQRKLLLAHWMGIKKIACIKSKADFSKTVYAYTKTSIGMFEALVIG